jgi:hypothetical protein
MAADISTADIIAMAITIMVGEGTDLAIIITMVTDIITDAVIEHSPEVMGITRTDNNITDTKHRTEIHVM